MPDLGNNSKSLTLTRCPNSLLPCPLKTLTLDNHNDSPCDFDSTSHEIAQVCGTRNGILKIRVRRMSSGAIDGSIVGSGCSNKKVVGGAKCLEDYVKDWKDRMSSGAIDGSIVSSGCSNKKVVGGAKCLEDYVKDWKDRMISSGVPENRCFLPFLVGSPKLAECRACSRYVYPGDGISCSVQGCQGFYHLKCAKDILRCSVSRKFKCPQHVCFICKQRMFWRCVRCEVASHDKCAAWPEKVIHLSDRPGWAICWRHPKDWRQEKHAVPANTFKEIFSSLPLPYIEEEFRMESTLKDSPNDKVEPPPYVHIRRNVYLVKKKREDSCVDIGCTSCSSTSTCSEDCVCRVQSISCSKVCGCSEACTNRPFRKERKIKIVKTELCGWGVVAAESVNKGDFIIEYVGEVIDDIECTQRLWDMKSKNVKNFYMCEIRKDFTIDATFKGNASRFLNHSCDPNCKLEKWQVEGEIRVGVFAARSIKLGEPLTYDYRFVQFGPEVKCHCGAANCQGYLGAKRKISLDILDTERRMRMAGLCWGSKRKRSTANCLAIVSV